MTKKKLSSVCFVSYIFPPMNAGGSVRSKNFVKYLGRLGHSCHVLTVRLPGIHSNDELKNELGFTPDVTVHRTFSLDPFRAVRSLGGEMKETSWQKLLRWISSFLLVPDRQVLWIPFAVFEGQKIMHDYHCQVIYSTFGPASNHLVALILKWLTKKPWIADFRDPWTTNQNFHFATPIHYWLHRFFEGLVVRFANKVVAVNDYIMQSLSTYPYTDGKLTILPHGFDTELIDKYRKTPIVAKRKFTIGYMGSFFMGRSPDRFLKAVESVLSSGRVNPDQFRIVFMSNLCSIPVSPALKKVLELRGFSSHEEALKLMAETSVLLLIVEQELKDQILNVKLFDYMGMGKPILALVPPDGATATHLKPSRLGIFADPTRIEDIVQKISLLYESWKQGELILQPDADYISQFEAAKITKRLSFLIEEIPNPTLIQGVERT